MGTDDPTVVSNSDLVYSEKLGNLVDKVNIIKIDVEGADYLAPKDPAMNAPNPSRTRLEFAP